MTAPVDQPAATRAQWSGVMNATYRPPVWPWVLAIAALLACGGVVGWVLAKQDQQQEAGR